MSLRSTRERILQSLCYEAGGLLLSVPLFMLWAGSEAHDSLILMVALSLAVLFWSGVYNTIFDVIEFRLTGRVASDRPWRLRIWHGVGLEFSSVLVTLPLIVWIGGLSWGEALLADLGLTALYAAYGWLFHLIFDRIRPVAPATDAKETS